MSAETRRLVLGEGTRGAVTRCRDFTRRALADWHWFPPPGEDPADSEAAEAAEDVLLMVSELVSNALMHAGGPRELILRHTPGRAGLLRMEVGDANPAGPRLKSAADPALPGGHGLMVLARLSRTWGWERYTDGRVGKTVWAEVPAPPAYVEGPAEGPPPVTGRPVTGLREDSSAAPRGSG